MYISKNMLPDIPSSITQIQSTNECKVIIDNDEFLMMGPVESHVTKILKDVVIWMTHDMNVAMSRGALWTKRPQCVLGMGGIASQCLLDFLVDDHVNLDTTFGGALEDLVKTPFLVEKRRPAQEQLWG